jgi:hypothetical protein
MELEIIAKQNPWWKEKSEIENDEDIKKWREGKLNGSPFVLMKLA